METLKLTRDRWTVLNNKPLGTPGGFAAVFPGFSANGDPVAIKVFHKLDPATSSRELKFATERMGKQDPHVIQILDCGIDLNSGRACIVMTRAEYSLAQKLAADGKLALTGLRGSRGSAMAAATANPALPELPCP